MQGWREPRWDEVKAAIGAEIDRLRGVLEQHQPEHATAAARGGISTLRRLEKDLGQPETANPHQQIQPPPIEV